MTTTEVTAPMTSDLGSASSSVPQCPPGIFARSGQWMEYAACGGVDPDLFAPGSPMAVRLALSYCNRCPVTRYCAEARDGAAGTWGGEYFPEATRSKLCALADCNRERQNNRSHFCSYEHEHAAKVGTRAGYDLHIREKTEVCPPCREAKTRSRKGYGNRHPR